MKRSRALILLLLLLLTVGCAGPARSGKAEGQPPTADPATQPPQTDTPPPSRKPEPGSEPVVRLAFVGDVLLGGGLAHILSQRGSDYPWKHVAAELQSADLAIANLETAVTTGGRAEPGKEFTFRSHPSTLAGAARAGIDLWSLANNHSRDFGPEALVETIDQVRKAGMTAIGAGDGLSEALRPEIREVNGLRIAVLAISRVIPDVSWVAWEGHPGVAPGWDPAVVREVVAKAKAEADHVVLLVHWGLERTDEPREADVALATAAFEAGATLIVGHHPHVLQGIDWRGPKLVAYSLGNFIFPTVARPLNQQTGILTVELDRSGVRAAGVTPLVLVEGQPGPPEAEEAVAILERLNRLSTPYGVRIEPSGELQRVPPTSGRACPPCSPPSTSGPSGRRTTRDFIKVQESP